ncbi:MAG: glycoside hydrolase family 16 protein [Bacilli bacterium]|nr:glycoside hydrolase family 16 protein [Bacilli bacterium]
MKTTFKPFASTFLLAILNLTLFSCTNSKPIDKSVAPSQGDEYYRLSSVQIDEDNVVFDDFTTGVNYDYWFIGSGAWGSGNGGVVPDNVFYTEDGYLLLRGNGMYYSKNDVKGVGTLKDGRNTGAVIISKFNCRPGHYEVKMKPLLRKGACTALWTYTNRENPESEERDNHEIDIELPGGNQSGSISFKNILNTNYVTEAKAISQDVVLENVTHGKVINLNDGKFHTFGFDWYTDPELVVYFIDGYVSAVSDTYVPSLESKLWLGNWFPNNSAFVGMSQFETDYMVVDYISYLPFLNQPYVTWNADVTVATANKSLYPTSPITLPKANLVANGDFEYFTRKGVVDGYGWSYAKLAGYKNVEISDVCFPTLTDGNEESAGATIKEGGYLSASVDSVYAGQNFRLSLDAKSSGSSSKVIVRYRDNSDSSISSDNIEITSSDYQRISKEITAPETCYSILIQVYNQEADTVINIDNFYLERI